MTYNIKYTSFLSDIWSETKKQNSRPTAADKNRDPHWKKLDNPHESPIVSRCMSRITNGLSAITTTPTAIENQAMLA